MTHTHYSIDLNCDMGEGMETDKEIMPFISSANIACGYHAGDEATIRKTIEYCLQYNVAIGAHPGFDDKLSFGRKEVTLSEEELYQLVTKQVQLVKVIAEDRGGRLHHVKAHGALYNMAAKNETYARVLAQAVKDIDPALLFYGLSNSIMLTAAEAISLKSVAEVFADRTYQSDGQLTPRSHAGALITDVEASVNQVLQMVKNGTVQSVTGVVITLSADTICLHGDGVHAVNFAEMINARLKKEGIEVKYIT
jgi:UPF0271 protein